MNLKEIKIEPEMFKEWLKTSVPRPVLLIGTPPDDEKPDKALDEEWFNYTINIPVMAGYWDSRKYGAYAFAGYVPTWYEEKLYAVPSEQYIEEDTLCPDRGWQRMKMSCLDAIKQAEAQGGVEKRFAWVNDENDVLRIASRALRFEYAKRDYKEGLLKGILNANLRLVSEEDYGKYSAIKS